jgi:lysophospholipase L1-like esterase
MSTITTIAASDVISSSRTVINANFAALNADKVDINSSYPDPAWLTSVAATKLAGVVAAVSGGAGAVNGLLKANGSGLVSAAAAGTDYVVPAGNVATATLAAAATALATPRTIAGVSFDGTANIAIASTGLSDSAALVRGAASVASGGVPYATSAGVLGTDAARLSYAASGSPELRFPVLAKTSTFFNVAFWGDSMTAGSGGTPAPTLFNTSTNLTTYNGGVGGETSTQIRTRMVADTARLGNTVVIWAGRNNFLSPDTVKADIAAMVAALTSPKRFLVLGITNGESGAEYQGGANYNAIVTLNADLAALYPDNFLDIRAVLVAQYNPGIAQDVLDFGRDIVPSSLRSDQWHLNTAGNAIVAAQVEAWIAARSAGLVSLVDLGRFVRALPLVTGLDGFLSVANGLTVFNAGGSGKYLSMAGDGGGLLTNGSFRPDANGTRDLGSLSLRWKDAFFSGSLSVTGNVGAGAFVAGVNSLYQAGDAGGWTVTGSSFSPSVNAANDLGRNGLAFRDLHLTGAAYVGTGAGQSAIDGSGDIRRVRVASAGRSQFTLTSTFGATSSWKAESGDGYSTMGTTTAHPLILAVNDVEAMRIFSSTRNMAIGANLDDGVNRLQVNGSVSATSVKLTGLAEPAANTGNEGLMVYIKGTSGVSGSLRICAQLTDGSYAWVPLF